MFNFHPKFSLCFHSTLSKWSLVGVTHQVFTFELVLVKGELFEFPWKLEGSEDRVLAGQRDEGGGGQRPVRVDPGPGVAEAVLQPRLGAILAPASVINQSQLKTFLLLHIDFPLTVKTVFRNQCRLWLIDSAKWIRERKEYISARVLPLMMGCRHHSAPVQQDLDDLVVVGVGGEDERGNVGGEGGRVAVKRLWVVKPVLCTGHVYSFSPPSSTGHPPCGCSPHGQAAPLRPRHTPRGWRAGARPWSRPCTRAAARSSQGSRCRCPWGAQSCPAGRCNWYWCYPRSFPTSWTFTVISSDNRHSVFVSMGAYIQIKRIMAR